MLHKKTNELNESGVWGRMSQSDGTKPGMQVENGGIKIKREFLSTLPRSHFQ